MSESHRRLVAVQALVVPVGVVALLLATPLTGQQKKGAQRYLDQWVKVPFCGSVTITKQGNGEASSRGTTWKKQEFGQLTANIRGAKDVISDRTGKAYGFFLEGTVNTTYKYHEVATTPGAPSMVWDLDATGHKQHTYEPGAYEWTDLFVNRAQGLYRFHPPSGKAKGTMTYTLGPETKQQPASFDEWYMASDAVDDVDRPFDPEKGIISGFANFTWSNMLGIKDYFGRENVVQDNFPPIRQSEEKAADGQRIREQVAKTLKEAAPDLVRPVTFQVSWNLNLDTGACQRTVRILYPPENKEFAFGQTFDEKKNLYFEGTAEADPQSYERNVYPWDVDNIEGSTKELKGLGPNCTSESDATPVKGRCVVFRFKGLPKDNAQFGKKTITADIAEPRHIKVFYKKFEKDNPEGKDANWFYYWKQGAVPGLDKFKYVDPPPSDCATCSGWFNPPDVLVILDRSALCQDAGTITLYERLPGFVNPGSLVDIDERRDKIKSMEKDLLIRVFRTIEVEELKGVDKCHAKVLHELKHKWVYDSFNDAISSGAKLDQDGDCLPDFWEVWTQALYQFDPLDPDTHFMRFQLAGGYYWYGDEEVLCREAERNHAAVHELDWATPGKQSQNKDECNVQR